MKVNIASLPHEVYAPSRRKLRPTAVAGALALLAVLAAPLASASGADDAGVAPPVKADLVLVHGQIYTVDAARSWASALAVRGRKLVYVGDEAGAQAWIGPGTRQIDLGGRFVIPGFIDSHVHPVWGGVELLQCDLNDADDADDLLVRIRGCLSAHPTEPWIAGGGWDLPHFPGASPHKSLLDALTRERPIFLSSADGHSAWVNSKALALAGITAATTDPANGRIERDPATGEPTGTLREAAKALVFALIPPTSAAERLAGLRLAVERAHRFGITSWFEASAGEPELSTYRDLDRSGELALSVRVSLAVDPRQGVEQVAELVSLRDRDWGPHVRAGAAKLYVDGVIEAGTAALLEPYLQRDGARGEPVWSDERLREMALALDRAGFQLHFHAIGDRAVRSALDAIEIVGRENGARDRRPTLAHIQLIDPADIGRFRALGAAPNFQPLWAFADTYIRDLTEPFLGAARSRWLYPIRSVAATGALLAAGSDWSVSTMNPLEAIEVAITRRDPDAEPGPAWIPDERVDLATMLAAYTIGGAWVTFAERESGSVEVGKYADLAVLDRNLFEIAAQEISEARVVLTLFGGGEVWRDASFPSGR